MTTRRGSRRSFRGRPARRKTYWDQNSFQFTPAAAPTLQVRDISNIHITDLSESGGTILRMIGQFNYYHEAASIETFNYGIGVAVITQDALAAGAVPDPQVDLNQDWYYWDSWEGVLINEGQHQVNFDIRTARKLREGYRLVMVMQSFIQELAGFIRVDMRNLWTLG